MCFRIKNENKIIPILAVVSLCSAFLPAFLPVWCLYLSLGLVILFAFMSLFDRTVGTTLVIEDRIIKVRTIFGAKKIPVDGISHIQIERYRRWRKRYHTIRLDGVKDSCAEYRMRMTINMNNNKKVVLTDSAISSRDVMSYLSCSFYELPDEEIPLFNAYQYILTMI